MQDWKPPSLPRLRWQENGEKKWQVKYGISMVNIWLIMVSIWLMMVNNQYMNLSSSDFS